MLLIATAVGRSLAAAPLEPFGLAGKSVASIAYYGWLYAGTLGDGVFKRDAEAQDDDWLLLGLADKRIRAVYPHASGPLGFATSVGLEGNPLLPDSALVFCAQWDQPPWVVADSGMVRSEVTAIFSLDGFPSPVICGETFAASVGARGGVWRREFGSTQWEFVLDVGFGVGNVVRVDAASGNVWAGGENGIFAPWIARSSDQGESWLLSYPDMAGDNACNSIAVHPADPDVAYAGMEGAVIRTDDGGVSWQPTGLANTPAYTYGLALDSAAPGHILAGGMVANPNNWALWESFNAGATWQVVDPPAPGTAGISSIVADPLRGGVFYIATFGNGVFRYRRTASGGDPLPTVRARLLPARPNPFNARTVLPFELPETLAARVVLAIYDARGELKRVLLDATLSSGPHRAAWDGTDARGHSLASGVYYCRLSVDGRENGRAVVLLK
jgi:hypothetical protein